MKRRSFLLLQGPPGPFFWLLAEELRSRGFIVHRINLNGGDRYDWPESATDYTAPLAQWPLFIDEFLRENEITDLILYGDCRPMHRAAHGMAKLRQVSIHVLEEGYIRPDWMTFEPDGVNGNSTLNRDPDAITQEARALPPPKVLPPVTASFKRRARDSFWYYAWVVAGRLRFPHYRSHRPVSVFGEALGWIAKFVRSGRRQRQAIAVLDQVRDVRYFIFPLQLTADYQIRAHSPFDSMVAAADFVLASFARCAAADVKLLVKEHPLDSGFLNWRTFLRRAARAHGVEDRVLHLAGGDLEHLAKNSCGMVCVNSTSGTLALGMGTPVMVLGHALYDIPGITHQGQLDAFWSAPEPCNPALYNAFRRVLQARCLVRGGLASSSAIAMLTQSVVDRLICDPAHSPPVPAL